MEVGKLLGITFNGEEEEVLQALMSIEKDLVVGN